MSIENNIQPQENFLPINPEMVKEQPFQVSEFIRGDNGYKFSGLHLPRNWQHVLPKVFTAEAKRFIIDRFKGEARVDGAAIEPIKYDGQNILRQISLRNASLNLNPEGEYVTQGIANPSDAITIHRHASIFINQMNHCRCYPYIQECGKDGTETESFMLVNFRTELEAWEKVWDSNNEMTDKNYRGQFIDKLKEHARLFGEEIENIEIESSGALNHITLKGLEQASLIDLDGKFMRFQFQGVNSPKQAMTLFNLGAKYMNELLK